MIDPSELRSALQRQERFAPDSDRVRARVGPMRTFSPRLPRIGPERAVFRQSWQKGTHSAGGLRSWPIAAAAAAAVAVVVVAILVHGPTTALTAAHEPYVDVVWQLRSATLDGVPQALSTRTGTSGRSEPLGTLRLLSDGTFSVAAPACYAVYGHWRSSGKGVDLFDGAASLIYCGGTAPSGTAAREVMSHLNGELDLSIEGDTMTVTNPRVTAVFVAAGRTAPSTASPPSAAASTSSTSSPAYVNIRWVLTSASIDGRTQALPTASGQSPQPVGPAILQLFPDGTTTESGPACFAQTGRWVATSDGFELVDQRRASIYCYLVHPAEEIPGNVLESLTGPLAVAINGSTMAVTNDHVRAVFVAEGPATSRGPDDYLASTVSSSSSRSSLRTR